MHYFNRIHPLKHTTFTQGYERNYLQLKYAHIKCQALLRDINISDPLLTPQTFSPYRLSVMVRGQKPHFTSYFFHIPNPGTCLRSIFIQLRKKTTMGHAVLGK